MFLFDENCELSRVWGKELFESEERKKKDEQSERVFLPPIVLVLFLQKVQKKLCQKIKISSPSSPSSAMAICEIHSISLKLPVSSSDLASSCMI